MQVRERGIMGILLLMSGAELQGNQVASETHPLIRMIFSLWPGGCGLLVVLLLFITGLMFSVKITFGNPSTWVTGK